LIITRPNGSGQLIGNSRPAAFAKKAAFRLVDLADEPGLVLEVGPLHARHLAAGAIDCLPLASEITQTFLEQPCYRTVQGLDRIVDRLKKSLSELEPPTCERCTIDMRWFMSKLERQEPVTTIVRSFVCPGCEGVAEPRPSSSPCGLSRTSSPRREPSHRPPKSVLMY
jgi:hypothetical protein